MTTTGYTYIKATTEAAAKIILQKLLDEGRAENLVLDHDGSATATVATLTETPDESDIDDARINDEAHQELLNEEK